MARNDWFGGAALAVAAGTALTTAIAMAVTGAVGPATPRAAADELPAFDSCPQLAGWYRDLALQQVTPYGLPGSGPMHAMLQDGVASYGAVTGTAGAAAGSGGAVPMPAPVAATEKAASAVTNGPTGTNLQDQSVDEPDVAKVDGDRVVGVAGATLYVSTVGSDVLSSPATVALPVAAATELLLDGDRALVIGYAPPASQAGTSGGVAPGAVGSASVGAATAPGAGTASGAVTAPDAAAGPGDAVAGPAILRPAWWSGRVALVMVDLSGGAPRVTGSELVDGSYVSARLTGDTARIVVTSDTTPEMVGPASPGAEQTALAANRAAIRNATAQQWLPGRELRAGDGRVVSTGPLLQCADVRHPVGASGLGTLSVLTMRLDADHPLEAGTAVAISAAGDLVYASADRLYVATSRWGDGGGSAPGGTITTQIHAFDAGRPGETSYAASGSVPGFLYDRWAMDEYDGVLRVATTSAPAEPVIEPMPMPAPAQGSGSGTGYAEPKPVAPASAPAASQSSVVTLRQDGARLVQVGRLDGLGVTEQVRAVRWLGDLAAVVTFRQTDPLYLVDLDDPAHPSLAGQLKVDGYSGYLHPVGDGLLLGVGHDADADGRLGPAMVQLFDVRDPATPTRTAQVALGQGQFLVEQEARAFTFTTDGLAVLPYQRWDGSGPRAGAYGVIVQGTSLATGPQFTAPTNDQTLRVLPVGGRFVAVGFSTLTLLDGQLHATGQVPLPGR